MQVRVFTAAVVDPSAADAATALLPETDRLRVQGMRTEKRRLEFVGGRLLARQSLAAVYGERSDGWEIGTQANGAICLAGNGAPAISLSHSKGRIACALAEVPWLGVDIELVKPRKHLPALAAEVLHPDELAEFSRLDGDRQAGFFYAKWVAKEALGKALGYGINYPMREILLHGERLLDAPQAWIPDAAAWRFSHTLLAGGYSLGLAWRGDTANSVSIENIEIHL